MSSYALVLLSKNCHLEGYLDIKLNELIKEELASDGFQKRDDYFMHIVYDSLENPHIMFDGRYFNEVKNELEKRVIKINGIITSNDPENIIRLISNEKILKIIAEKDNLRLKTINLN